MRLGSRFRHFIYLIENAQEGIWYVGLTGTSIRYRWWQHKTTAQAGKGSALHAAMRQFGIENFEIQQVQAYESRAAASDAEIAHIARLKKQRGSEGCLNRTLGGAAIVGRKGALEHTLDALQPLALKLAEQLIEEALDAIPR